MAKPELRYRSTGKPVFSAEKDESAEMARSEFKDKMQRNAQMREAIADRNFDRIENHAAKQHDEAVKHFDYAYKDVVGNPNLLREVLIERAKVINDAAQKREVIDWNSAYPDIGERIRQRAGLPTSAERERAEYFDEVRASRPKQSE